MRGTQFPRFVLLALAASALAGCNSGGGSNKSAQIRLLNVSPGYDSLDVYVDDEDDDGDSETLALESVGFETVSDYTDLDSGTYALEFKRSGVSGTLKTVTGANLTDESRTTFVAYGSTGSFSVISIDEGTEEPDSGDTVVRVFNAAEAVGSLSVYFTDATVDLENVSPDFSGIGSGTATLDSGSYRLRITGAGDTDDVRLDVPEIALDSGAVISLILTSTQGGTLVNAVVLPQDGELSTIHNTKSRIRGAIGISSGAMTTLRIAGATLFSNASAGAIGSKYSQVNAGPAGVVLSIDGTFVDIPDQTHAAGGDYTLLAWNDAAGAHATLIEDDNRLPSGTGEAKIRLINGMSAFGDPLSLAIDYSPIVEGVALGQASSFVDVDSGTDFQLDMTSALTAANVLTRTSITLQAGGVYTMFMAGGAASDEASGVLRKDR